MNKETAAWSRARRTKARTTGAGSSSTQRRNRLELGARRVNNEAAWSRARRTKETKGLELGARPQELTTGWRWDLAAQE